MWGSWEQWDIASSGPRYLPSEWKDSSSIITGHVQRLSTELGKASKSLPPAQSKDTHKDLEEERCSNFTTLNQIYFLTNQMASGTLQSPTSSPLLSFPIYLFTCLFRVIFPTMPLQNLTKFLFFFSFFIYLLTYLIYLFWVLFSSCHFPQVLGVIYMWWDGMTGLWCTGWSLAKTVSPS